MRQLLEPGLEISDKTNNPGIYSNKLEYELYFFLIHSGGTGIVKLQATSFSSGVQSREERACGGHLMKLQATFFSSGVQSKKRGVVVAI